VADVVVTVHHAGTTCDHREVTSFSHRELVVQLAAADIR
jgi:hypothetical protein